MTAPRHRRPDREKTNPQSEYYIPNDPANRIAAPDSGHRPQHVPRKTLLETAADLGGTVEEAKLQKRLQEAQDENGGYPEATSCPLCNTPAMLVGPGQVSCPCRPEPFHVGTELAKRRDKLDAERRMILQCMREDQARGTPGGGGSSNGRTRKEPAKMEPRIEQDWHGWAEARGEETEVMERFVFVVKAKIPPHLKARLRNEATLHASTESRMLRWYLSRHLVGIEMAREVERCPSNQWVEFKMTKQMFQVFDGKAKSLGCSRADLLLTIMSKEWE